MIFPINILSFPISLSLLRWGKKKTKFFGGIIIFEPNL